MMSAGPSGGVANMLGGTAAPPPGVRRRHLDAHFTQAKAHAASAITTHHEKMKERQQKGGSQQRESSADQQSSSVNTPFGYLNVMAFGAVADGATDNTAAFNKALAAGAGGKIFVPPGNYFFSGTLSLPPYTVLEGVNEYPFSAFGGGSVLLVTSGTGNVSAAPFIYMNGPNAGVRGLTFLYPNQNASASTPEVYPPCLQGNGDDISVINVLLGNPYIGIDCATYPCGRHLFENVYGQPLYLGIQIDQIYDIGRIRHVHFWPFWTQGNLLNWVHLNGITFWIMRSDWEVMEDVFSWGYDRGIIFDHSVHGACNGQFTDINFDNVNIGIDVRHTWPYGIFFSNLNLANAGNGDLRQAIRCVQSASNAQLIVRGMAVWGLFYHAAYWHCGGKMLLSDGVIDQWNSSHAAIHAVTGRVNIRGMYFTDSIGVAIRIEASVDRAIVLGNDLIGNTLECEGTDRLCGPNLP